MPGPKPGGNLAARPGGGFRSSFGQLGEGHLEQNAMTQAVGQKQLAQQGTSSTQQQTGGSALKSLGSKQTAGSKAGKANQKPPRSVGTIPEEAKIFVGDIAGEVKKFFSLSTLLNIDTSDTSEVQAKKRKTLQRWQKLTQAEQQVAKQRYQEEMKKKQEEEKQKQIEKQKKEQANAQSIAPPASPRKGPMGPGSGMSKKAKASANLQRQMKTKLSVAGAG